MFNSLLKHVSFQASLEGAEDGSLTNYQLLCDQTEVFTLTERLQEGASSAQTSLLPNRTLKSRSGSPMDLLFGLQPEEPAFDFLAAISQAEASYKALIDACEPYAEKKRANYKIKDIGTSKWSQIARLTTEQSDAMLPLLRAVLQSGMDAAYRKELDQVRFGKGFIVALYKAGENDRDLAVYMKGSLLYPDGSTYKLTYQWAFVNQGVERKDTYKYEALKSGSPADRRVASAKATQKLFSTEISLKGSSETTLKKDIASSQVFKFDLSGKDTGQGRTLKGTWSQEEKRTEEGETVTTLRTYAPELILTSSPQGAVLSGSVEVEEKKDKILTSSLTLILAPEIPEAFASLAQSSSLYAVEEPSPIPSSITAPASPLPASSIELNADQDPELNRQEDTSGDYLVGAPPIGLTAFPIPSQMKEISLDNLPDSALNDLLTELSQNLAGRLLIAVSQLPAEDLALLKDGLTPEDATRLLSLIGGL
jgi:hypothetical protein